MKNFSLLLFSAFLSLLFYQCQTDEITETPLVTGEIIAIDENITSDVTWTSGNIYVLTGMIAVTDNATLTIEPCVVVKAENGVTGLVIDRGAKINAEGTAECPIIFTSSDDLLEPGEIVSPNLTGDDHGLWSGIFILGNAPVSSADSIWNMMSLLPNWDPFVFGGNDPDDNSGVLRYVSIRHTGFETAPFEIPSGINLGGVGSGTTIDKVEVFANSDDGLMTLGGTVNVNNFIVSYYKDDGYDCDMGYAGTMDNLIGIGGVDSHCALEIDGGEGLAKPSYTIRNASFNGSLTGKQYIRFNTYVNCLIENAYFFGFDSAAQVRLGGSDVADDWVNELIDVVNLEINTSHLSTGNTTIETIFYALNGNDAFTVRPPDATIVTTPTVGADKSVFAGWTAAGQTGALDDF
ncbi:MAG: hypothetical protein WA004_02785 [Saprospiraceae bacterium]